MKVILFNILLDRNVVSIHLEYEQLNQQLHTDHHL